MKDGHGHDKRQHARATGKPPVARCAIRVAGPPCPMMNRNGDRLLLVGGPYALSPTRPRSVATDRRGYGGLIQRPLRSSKWPMGARQLSYLRDAPLGRVPFYHAASISVMRLAPPRGKERRLLPGTLGDVEGWCCAIEDQVTKSWRLCVRLADAFPPSSRLFIRRWRIFVKSSPTGCAISAPWLKPAPWRWGGGSGM